MEKTCCVLLKAVEREALLLPSGCGSRLWQGWICLSLRLSIKAITTLLLGLFLWYLDAVVCLNFAELS